MILKPRLIPGSHLTPALDTNENTGSSYIIGLLHASVSSDTSPAPPLSSAQPPYTDSQLPALSYLELQDRGQGKEKRKREG